MVFSCSAKFIGVIILRISQLFHANRPPTSAHQRPRQQKLEKKFAVPARQHRDKKRGDGVASQGRAAVQRERPKVGAIVG